ncbi:MAG TPA: PH domain-containing protein [Anaerolineae bacterium]|nr:PH domain-containing protein [Anaerolineae bacterium]HQK12504.1 PH domain-containing protein [Anaerolineae bacterium]
MRRIWNPEVRWGWIVGLAIVAVLIAVTVSLVVLTLIRPISVWTFLRSVGAVGLLVVIIRVLYQLWGLINASYEMDRNALIIHWGGTHYTIPMAAVGAVLSGAELKGLRLHPGLRWPGYFVGLGEAPDIGPILFFATQPLHAQVIVRTPGMAYAISPKDLEEFLLLFRERLDMGPTQEVEESSTHPAFLDWAIWKDRFGLTVLLGSLTLLVLLVGLLCWRYPYLPAQITMRFAPSGEALLVVESSRIFYLTLLGIIFLVVNGGLGLLLYHRERIATYFLWSGLLVVLGSLWAAAIFILLRQ